MWRTGRRKPSDGEAAQVWVCAPAPSGAGAGQVPGANLWARVLLWGPGAAPILSCEGTPE